MPTELILLLTIVTAALVMFVSGKVRVDLVGLLVLVTLALTQLVTTQEALAGFSSPAVVTVWAMFILSAGLTRTGLAHRIGRPIQRFATAGEVPLMVAIMLTASLLSALINTVTVAAILLPVVMEVARRSGRSPSRLLLPLALGCLLGGPFTGISTPPNILVTEALDNAGLRPFGLFEFTPITGAIVIAGIAFVVVAGRHLLPRTVRGAASDALAGLGSSYLLEEHLFTVWVPAGSALVGKTLAGSRLGSALSLSVVAIQRQGRLVLDPRANEVIRAGDGLVIHGRPEHLQRIGGRAHLTIEDAEPIGEIVGERLPLAEATIGEGSVLAGRTVRESALRGDHHVHVVAVGDGTERSGRSVSQRQLGAGDRLLLRGERQALEAVEHAGLVEALHILDLDGGQSVAGVGGQLMPVRVPQGSMLADATLAESRLAGFGLTVVAILRDSGMEAMPSPDETVIAGDVLLLDGAPEDLELLEALQELEISEQADRLLARLESQQIGITEVLLSPRSTLVGRSLSELLFRDHYGVTVLAVWSEGRAYRSGLQERPLRFGDALLVYGHRRSLEAMARDPDFIVLDETAARVPRLEKARTAGLIMVAVLVAALSGQVPIAIAALGGAALMVATGCINMEEAYRGIEWRVVFLVACMLPLGNAIEHTGAAQIGAEALLGVIGDMSPRWVVAGVFAATVICAQVIHPAALVVIIAPIALSISDTVGISPHLLMMTVAISASSTFASPISHPAPMLVMGPGGYRYSDYLKIGAPITLVAMAVSVGLLPVLFPP